ncbi:isochorismatase [Salinithrix halophila]|uniref:Isochorismatase n=1 Tax=Salinithrix halophila TaxID=1485204 RepID=A0ABV8JEA3_9BACL
MEERDTGSLYQPRPIQFQELWKPRDWQIKVYGITAPSCKLTPSLLEAAKETVASILPSGAQEEGRHGVGFMGVHAATDGNFLFVDWWWNTYELNHQSFLAPPDSAQFKNVTPTGRMFCIWELYVLGFEREAWIHALLKNPTSGMDGYLEARLNQEI